MSTHQLGGGDVREHLCRGRGAHCAQIKMLSPPLKTPFLMKYLYLFLTKLFDHKHTSIL